MTITRRIFISSPRDIYLDERRRKLKRAIVDAIERLDPSYEAQEFGTPEGGRGLPAGKQWSAEEAERVMRRCVGAAVLGFPICRFEKFGTRNAFSLATEYCHYEGALARVFRLPVLAVREAGVEERCFFAPYGGDPALELPIEAGSEWVRKQPFLGSLKRWHTKVTERSDLFLAYSSKQQETANRIHTMLTGLGATVYDWRRFAGRRDNPWGGGKSCGAHERRRISVYKRRSD